MKRIQSKAGLLKRRVENVHGRAKLVGNIYLWSVIAMLVIVALFPLMNGTTLYDGGVMPAFAVNAMPVVSVYGQLSNLLGQGFGNLLSSADNVLTLLQCVLYFVLVLVLFIKVICALCKLNWLYKKKASYINGFNRNMYAMDALGKIFSSSFAWVLIVNLLCALLTKKDTLTPAPTLIGYILIGVMLLVRFIFGSLEGSVTLFTTGEKIVEKERDHGVFSYFVRNFVQVLVCAGLLFFLVAAIDLVTGVETVLSEVTGGAAVMDIILAAVPVVVQLLVLIFFMVMLKHATASTEYSRDCNHTAGRHNFAIFGCITMVLSLVLLLYPYCLQWFFGRSGAELNYPLLWMTIILFVGFLFDCLFRARDKKSLEDEIDGDPVPVDDELYTQPAQQVQALPIQPRILYPGMPVMDAPEGETLYAQPYVPQYVPQYVQPYAQSAQAQQPAQPQVQPYPVFMPMPYGYAPQMGMTQPVQPMQAPEYLLPVQSPQAAAAEAKEKEQAAEQQPEPVVQETVSSYKKFKVQCPDCGKNLMVKDNVEYHRCPCCDRVFTLQKISTYVKSE